MKSVISHLSELRYQMQTNKPMTPLQSGLDVQEWSTVFDVYRKALEGTEPQWFKVSWLFAECYMYRRIQEMLQTRYCYVEEPLSVDLASIEHQATEGDFWKSTFH